MPDSHCPFLGCWIRSIHSKWRIWILHGRSKSDWYDDIIHFLVLLCDKILWSSKLISFSRRFRQVRDTSRSGKDFPSNSPPSHHHQRLLPQDHEFLESRSRFWTSCWFHSPVHCWLYSFLDVLECLDGFVLYHLQNHGNGYRSRRLRFWITLAQQHCSICTPNLQKHGRWWRNSKCSILECTNRKSN